LKKILVFAEVDGATEVGSQHQALRELEATVEHKRCVELRERTGSGYEQAQRY
jgi:hypothetical protein